MKIKAIITLHANGKAYAPGSLVDLADEEAQRLVSRGFAESGEQEAFHIHLQQKQASSAKQHRQLKILLMRLRRWIPPKTSAKTVNRMLMLLKICLMPISRLPSVMRHGTLSKRTG
jgi:hypothetical protein